MGLNEAHMHEAAVWVRHGPVCAVRYVHQAWKKIVIYSFSLLVLEFAPISVKQIKSPKKTH